MKNRLNPFWISQTRHSSSVINLSLLASGRWSLKYKQTSLLHILEGWMQRKSLCPSIASLGSFHETKESKKVSVIQKISNQWTFKNAEICESFTQTLFKFQWQTDKELVHPPCPGLASIFHDCMMMQQP